MVQNIFGEAPAPDRLEEIDIDVAHRANASVHEVRAECSAVFCQCLRRASFWCMFVQGIRALQFLEAWHSWKLDSRCKKLCRTGTAAHKEFAIADQDRGCSAPKFDVGSIAKPCEDCINGFASK